MVPISQCLGIPSIEVILKGRINPSKFYYILISIYFLTTYFKIKILIKWFALSEISF